VSNPGPGWDRVASRGRTVYWNRQMADGRRLTVSRNTAEKATEPWSWRVYAPGSPPTPALASGPAGSVQQGRRAAEASAAQMRVAELLATSGKGES
jgi:hypothetical protein